VVLTVKHFLCSPGSGVVLLQLWRLLLFQARAAAGGGGAAAPAGDGGEEGDVGGETSRDEGESQSPAREKREGEAAAGVGAAGAAVQVQSVQNTQLIPDCVCSVHSGRKLSAWLFC